MHFFKNLIITFLGFLLITSCSQNDYKFKLNTPSKATFGEEFSISFSQIEGEKYDSIQLFVNDTKLGSSTTQKINTTNLGTGIHTVTALVFVPNKVKKIKKTFTLLSNISPPNYSYKVINTCLLYTSPSPRDS